MRKTDSQSVRQFGKFILVGLASTAADWTTYFLLTHVGQVAKLLAKTCSFIVGAGTSYTLNRRWTFESTNQNVTAEFARFFMVSLIGIGLNTLIFYLVSVRGHLSDIVGLVIATGAVTLYNFVAHKLWTFRQTPAKSER